MFSRISVISGMFAILTCMVVSNVSAQTTWYVATNGDDSAHTGKNGWNDAFLTINNAVGDFA